MKTILKLALVALVANATWHLWGAYAAHFKFKDAVQDTAQYGSDKPDEQIRERVLSLANQYDVPVTESNFTVSRKDNHTIINGAYTRPIDLAPGFSYPWSFEWHVDTFTEKSQKLDGSAIP